MIWMSAFPLSVNWYETSLYASCVAFDIDHFSGSFTIWTKSRKIKCLTYRSSIDFSCFNSSLLDSDTEIPEDE